MSARRVPGPPADPTPRAGAAAPQGDPRVKLLLAALLALLLVGGIALGLRLAADRPASPATATPTNTAGDATPRPRAALGPGQGMVVGPPTTAASTAAKASGPRIDVYLDPQCPWCKRFHEVLKAGFDDLRARGAATIVLHPRMFLDAKLGNDSSHRAAQAMACVSDAGRLWEFTDAMFAAQPPEEGRGYTPAQIEGFAARSGLTGTGLADWRACVTDGRYAAYVDAVEDRSARDHVQGTPTYQVDGREADLSEVMPSDGPPNPQAFFDQVPAP